MQDCLTCEEFEKCDSGTLGEIELGRMREHLAACGECRSAYEKWRSSSPALRADATQSVALTAESGSSPSAKFAQTLPQIEGYRIAGVLGQGGMGVVYRAVQIKLNRTVALKVLPAIVASPQAVSRFRREAKAAARLHHTNIVPIYDFGESRDGYFYAMELIEGQPLNELIRKFVDHDITSASQARVASMLHKSFSGHPLPLVEGAKKDDSPSSTGWIDTSSSSGKGRAYYQQVARWIADAADALHYAHNEGIIHRDIKPGNLILSSDVRIMITDFGLAKCSDDESVTIPGVFMGAIRYVSPEQAMAGRVRVDHRTDIYSLGATMYELLALQPAFAGTDDKEILAAIIARDPTPLRKRVPTLPAELETICQKTLEKLPEARYATARALAEDLRRFLNDLPIVAKRPGHFRRVVKFAKRNRAISTAIVSGVIIAAMAWGLLVVRRAWQLDRLVRIAQMDEKEGSWKEAEAVYKQALEFDANNADVLVNISRAIQEQCDRGPYEPAMVSEAVEFCERARKLNSNLVNIENTYGVLLSMARRSDDALVVFNRDLPPDGAPAAHVWSNIAAVHYLSGDYAKARIALQNAIDKPARLEKTADGTLKPEPYFHGFHELATLELMQRDPHAAATIEEGIGRQPEDKKHFSYYLVKARILLTLPGKQDALRAHAAAETAKGLYRDKVPDPYIERYYALSLLRLGGDHIEQARPAIERSAKGRDRPEYTNLLTAIAEAKSGNADKAQAALDEADRVWPESLKKPGAIDPSRHLGMIWFESADELHDLRREVEELIRAPDTP